VLERGEPGDVLVPDLVAFGRVVDLGEVSLLVCVGGGPSGGGTEVGHAEVDGAVPFGDVVHRGELLLGGGETGLDRGDLAEPALFLGLLEPVEQVRADLFQAGPLLGIWP
jgi:hypothetical protein